MRSCATGRRGSSIGASAGGVVGTGDVRWWYFSTMAWIWPRSVAACSPVAAFHTLAVSSRNPALAAIQFPSGLKAKLDMAPSPLFGDRACCFAASELDVCLDGSDLRIGLNSFPSRVSFSWPDDASHIVSVPLSTPPAINHPSALTSTLLKGRRTMVMCFGMSRCCCCSVVVSRPDSTSQIFTVPSRDPLTTLPARGTNAALVTSSVCSCRVRTSRPVAVSHSFSVLSSDAVTIRVPSRFVATAETPAECPRSTNVSWLVEASQMRKVRSSEALTSRRPSRLNAISWTAFTCPRSVAVS